jgi:hypothetical protein
VIPPNGRIGIGSPSEIASKLSRHIGTIGSIGGGVISGISVGIVIIVAIFVAIVVKSAWEVDLIAD